MEILHPYPRWEKINLAAMYLTPARAEPLGGSSASHRTQKRPETPAPYGVHPITTMISNPIRPHAAPSAGSLRLCHAAHKSIVPWFAPDSRYHPAVGDASQSPASTGAPSMRKGHEGSRPL
jgi:hypothetical protein